MNGLMLSFVRSVLRCGGGSLRMRMPVRRNMTSFSWRMPLLEEEGREQDKKQRWLTYNDKVFPPQTPTQQPRPAYVCHMKENLKYSPKKMWYIACLVRGLAIEEALAQLRFVPKKGAVFAIETLLEAQKLALEEHNIEFKTNLWVAESFVGKGRVIKGLRRHARMRMGKVEYKYCHYFVRLEEGAPPINYYNRPSFDAQSMVNSWYDKMRSRKIISSL